MLTPWEKLSQLKKKKKSGGRGWGGGAGRRNHGSFPRSLSLPSGMGKAARPEEAGGDAAPSAEDKLRGELPHAVGTGSQLLPDAREAGIKVVHQPGLNHFIHLQHPRHVPPAPPREEPDGAEPLGTGAAGEAVPARRRGWRRRGEKLGAENTCGAGRQGRLRA